MLATKQKDGTIKWTRENWREWFVFEVDDFYKGAKLPTPIGYVATRFREGRIAWDYWFFLIAPFIIVKEWLWKKWGKLAVFCFKRGWLKIGEAGRGEPIKWYWFIYFFKTLK